MSPRHILPRPDDSHPSGDVPEIVTRHPAYRRSMVPETKTIETLSAYFPEKDAALEQALSTVHTHLTLHSERDDPRLLGKDGRYRRKDFGSVRIDDAWVPENDGLKRVAFVAAFLRRSKKTQMPELHKQTAVEELLKHIESGIPISDLAAQVKNAPGEKSAIGSIITRVRNAGSMIGSATKEAGKHIGSGGGITEVPAIFRREKAARDKARTSDLKISFHENYQGPENTLSISGADLRKLVEQAAKDSQKAPTASHAAAAVASKSGTRQLR